MVAFNTADGWMRDVTADIARELRFEEGNPAHDRSYFSHPRYHGADRDRCARWESRGEELLDPACWLEQTTKRR